MTARNLSVRTEAWKAKWAVFKIHGFVCKRFLSSFPSPFPLFYSLHFSRCNSLLSNPNLVAKVSHLTAPWSEPLSSLAPGGGKMRDPGNEVGEFLGPFGEKYIVGGQGIAKYFNNFVQGCSC